MTNAKSTSSLETFLCGADSTAEGLFLARLATLDASDSAPQRIQIFPKGPDLETNDGRAFVLEDIDDFIAAFNAHEKPVLIDFDHRSHFPAANGGSDRAAGWVTALHNVDGTVWGDVEWTVAGQEAIKNKEYRFLSPEFAADKDKVIRTLRAAGLVNRPAFQMTALAREEGAPMTAAIAKALGLPGASKEADIVAAIEGRDQKHSTELAAAKKDGAPSLDDYVPRADYDTVVARATTAEAAIETAKTSARNAEVEVVIAGAIKAGKIAPASKDHYVELAKSDEGFESVKKLIETMPAIVSDKVEDKTPPTEGALTREQIELCKQMGLSEEEYKKQLAGKAD